MSTPDLKFKITAEDDASRGLRQIKERLRELDRVMATANSNGIRGSARMAAGLGTASNRAKIYGTQINKASRHTTNLAFQLNDIGVMLASGQSPLVLAMQQGTQINQVFAQMGGGKAALKGIGAAALSVVNPMSLAVIATIAVGAALFKLGRKAFGASEEVLKFRAAIAEIDKMGATLKDQIEMTRGGIGSVAELDVTRRINDLETERLSIETDILAVQKRQFVSQTDIDRKVGELKEKMDGVVAKSKMLQERLANLDVARAKLAAEKLIEKIGAAGVKVLLVAGMDMTKPFTDATLEAAKLAGKLDVVLYKARNIIAMREAMFKTNSSIYSNRFAAEENLMSGGSLTPTRLTQEQIDAALGKPGGGGGGGGGGGSQVNAALSEAKRLYDSTRTSAEKYAATVARINELHKQFPEIVDDIVTSRALQSMRDDFQQVSKIANTIQSSMESAFMSMVDGTKTAEDAFRSMAQNIVQELYRVLVVQQIIGSFGTKTDPGTGAMGWLRSILSFEGGGYTGAGSRSGGIDGRGGFAAILHPNETVVDHSKGRSSGGGIVINQYFNLSANGDESVKKIIAQEAPRIIQATKRAVIEARYEGGQMRAAFQ